MQTNRLHFGNLYLNNHDSTTRTNTSPPVSGFRARGQKDFRIEDELGFVLDNKKSNPNSPTKDEFFSFFGLQDDGRNSVSFQLTSTVLVSRDGESYTNSSIELGGEMFDVRLCLFEQVHGKVRSKNLEQLNAIKKILESSGILTPQLISNFFYLSAPKDPSSSLSEHPDLLEFFQSVLASNGKSNGNLIASQLARLTMEDSV